MNATRLLPILFTMLMLTPAQAQHKASAESAGTLRLTARATGARVDAQLAASASRAQGGFFTLDEYLTYNAAVAVDPQGGTHLAFYLSDEKHEDNPLGQPAFYVYCPGGTVDCADPANWGNLIQFDSQVSEVQVVATADGRPRVLVRRYGSRAKEYNFWACDVQCTDAANWWGLYVVEAAGTELFGADMPQHSFALDAQDRPRFVYSNGWGIGRPDGVYYTFCDAADCTQPGSWQETKITFTVEYKTVTSDYATLVFDGDKPRVLTRYNESGLPVRMEYYACDADCGSPSGWARTIITHPEAKMWAGWDLVLDAAGQPKIALYEPAGIDIHVGGKLFYGWCEAGCSDVNATFRIVQVAAGEGKNVDLTIDAQGRTYMVYDAGQRGVLGAMWCDGDCTDPTQWQRQILKTSEQLMQDFAPANPLSCSQEERAWLDAIPSVTFDAQDRLVVAYDVKNVAVCYYSDPTRPNDPPTSRVERIWWATRVDFFTAPGGGTGTPTEEEHEVPSGITLEPNYPNPFNPATTIPFALRETGHVRLEVLDLLGRTVAVLVDEVRPAGAQQVAWNAAGLPSGIYLYRLEAGGETRTRTLTLFK